MGAVILLEGTSLTKVDWVRRLNIGSIDFAHLVDSRLLRLDDLGGYRLTFVGIVVFAQSILFAQPKFGDSTPLTLVQVLRVLRVYFGRSSRRRPYTDRARDPEYGNADVLREFDALQGLRDWFHAKGVYRREHAKSGQHGRPHWVRTIAKRHPVIVQGAVIYPSIIAERREGVLNEVSAMQIGLLRRLLVRYGFEVPSAILHAELATGPLVTEWPLTDYRRNYLLRRLALERRGAFLSDTLHLFELIQGALESRLAGHELRPQIYGTTAFYSVWEDACRFALSEPGAPNPVSMVGQPVWRAQGDDGKLVRHEVTQIPDIIVERNDWCVIIDAKYYYRFPDSYPGAPDIIKQFYYADSLRGQAEHVLSVFLLPAPGAAVPAFLGYATIEGSQRRFGNIEAWGVDPVALLARYVQALPSGGDDLVGSIITRRPHVTELFGEAPTNV